MSCLARRRCAEPFLLLAFLSAPIQAASSEEELFFKSVDDVSNGELRFLEQVPKGRPHHHHRNHIMLSAESLGSGWVRLEQCHEHLDAVPSSQIVYSEERIRNLRILRAEHIEQSWVEGHSVQMRNLRREAVLCVEAESRALLKDAANGYILRNGPYMRRFLDGYYPMRVTMTVSLGDSGLFFDSVSPDAQPGFTVRLAPGEVGYDTWFEGRLTTAIRFVTRDTTVPGAPTALQAAQPE